MDRAAISIIVDHLDVARGWSDAMQRAGRTLDVLVKVDVGFHRCGIDPDGDALGVRPGGRVAAGPAAARPAQPRRPRLSRRVGGRAARRSRSAKRRSSRRCASARRQSGIALDEISVGATPTLRFSAGERGLTELRPGNYVYFDRTQVALGAASLDDCALTVLATVVSKPAADRIILDCGSKTLTNDQARGIAAARRATAPSSTRRTARRSTRR